jgi:hypothetical protein
MSIARVVDRRFVEPAGDTGWSLQSVSTEFGDGGIQSSVHFDEIANELLLIGR